MNQLNKMLEKSPIILVIGIHTYISYVVLVSNTKYKLETVCDITHR